MNGSSKKASLERSSTTWSKLLEQPRSRTEANYEGKPMLIGMAQEVEDTIVKIMKEAASG